MGSTDDGKGGNDDDNGDDDDNNKYPVSALPTVYSALSCVQAQQLLSFQGMNTNNNLKRKIWDRVTSPHPTPIAYKLH